MFKPTISRQRRIERRLQGFRSQSIRILRKALASVDASALIPFKRQRSTAKMALSSSEPSCWRHSIYRYNKSTARTLPVFDLAVSNALRAYFNMTPRDVGFKALALSRAFLSDRRSFIAPHLLGKLSKAFWRSYRQLIEQQPGIQFNHFRAVSIRIFLYDRRLDLARQKLWALGLVLRRVINSR